MDAVREQQRGSAWPWDARDREAEIAGGAAAAGRWAARFRQIQVGAAGRDEDAVFAELAEAYPWMRDGSPVVMQLRSWARVLVDGGEIVVDDRICWA
ncbi:hypothetical protein ACFYWP_39845 [Actinacidiphila glaucinigra]|uniref:hypothetical protein n=1 Tax=Actinacidiphila glaucinigra TaxID=235986 RepID=UPI0036A06F89